MEEPITLPDLQLQLDRLSAGHRLDLSKAEVERLFGLNDVATRRLRNFAAGHGCTFAWTESGVCFLKQRKPDDPVAAS